MPGYHPNLVGDKTLFASLCLQRDCASLVISYGNSVKDQDAHGHLSTPLLALESSPGQTASP